MLDMLNTDARATRNIGFGMDLVPATQRVWRVWSMMPPVLSHRLNQLNVPLGQARALLGDVDWIPPEVRLRNQIWFCRIRDPPAGTEN